jgi:hypothetical protein
MCYGYCNYIDKKNLINMLGKFVCVKLLIYIKIKDCIIHTRFKV